MKMKCPHCSQKIGLFSKALNKFGNPKVCPSCNKHIKVTPNLKLIALLVVPVFIAHLFILKPVVIALGFNGKGLVGLWGALIVVFSMQLKSAEDS